MIAAIRPEIAAARVQSANRASVANDPPIPVERQHPIGAAVEKEQPFLAVNGKATRIGNAAVIAEGAEPPTAEIEGEKRAVAVTIGTARTGNEKSDCLLLALPVRLALCDGSSRPMPRLRCCAPTAPMRTAELRPRPVWGSQDGVSQRRVGQSCDHRNLDG